jgi:xylulokinase
MWLDALEMLLDTLSQTCDLSQITAISGAGQQHESVYLNECWQATLQSLNTQQALSAQIAPCLSRSTAPIWMDTSTQTECTEIAQTVGGNTIVCRKSGSIAIERFSGPQIRRFYKFQPQAYQQTQRIQLVSSFLCSVLCGQDAPIDIGDGAGMNLLNIESWQWDPELLTAMGPGTAHGNGTGASPKTPYSRSQPSHCR